MKNDELDSRGRSPDQYSIEERKKAFEQAITGVKDKNAEILKKNENVVIKENATRYISIQEYYGIPLKQYLAPDKLEEEKINIIEVDKIILKRIQKITNSLLEIVDRKNINLNDINEKFDDVKTISRVLRIKREKLNIEKQEIGNLINQQKENKISKNINILKFRNIFINNELDIMKSYLSFTTYLHGTKDDKITIIENRKEIIRKGNNVINSIDKLLESLID